jgi:hypothetical protein
MKIIVDSNLYIPKVFEPPIELNFEGGTITLKDVLERLANICMSVQFLKNNGELGFDVDELLLNRKNYFSLEQGLLTSLQEGDRVRVEIYMEPLGGG